MNIDPILFFSNPNLPEEISSSLRKIGLQVLCVPVLETNYEKHEGNVKKAFENIQKVKAIVFPSHRSVLALGRTGINVRHLKWYALRESTANVCLDILSKIPEVTVKKGLPELIDTLRNDTDLIGSQIIFLSGYRQKVTPIRQLKEFDISVRNVCCFSTSSVYKTDILKTLKGITPVACVFFNVAGVRIVCNTLKNTGWEWRDKCIFATEETVAKALREKKEIRRCDAIPQDSNLEGIKQMLQSYFRCKC
ncbi:unnamed protein product [Blepharisma stoltei]|uniref:Tetrapyrrole biosynthesis uroporphyrinogen III synthase domain-containing protein n=1 Tax=Blepharisma stoltei TaxID=1481888 RepID=A0AAU9IQ17_9CILI|nr:unnamed protein product [Blepharisma stoltei]